MAFIEIKDVTHKFKAREGRPIVALDDVTFKIEKGTFLSVIGPSGCGKTTLLRIVDGLIKPSSGWVEIDGKRVNGPDKNRAMVFQDFRLLPWRTTIKNIEFGLELQGVSPKVRRNKAWQLLKLVGLEGFEKSYPHEMSGGMKQRVGLARALLIGPDIMLMDEPFGSLDAQTRELMQIDLLKLWEKDKKTVVFITHSIEEAVFLSDDIVVMSARPGRIKERISTGLAKPRWKYDVKNTREFTEYRSGIWESLKEEIVL